jgi:TonB-linked SusC/RagA family outer membrane protein
MNTKQKLTVLICLLLMPLTFLFGQTRQITGVVTDASSKQPLQGVAVTIKGGKTGVTTDSTGAFKLSSVTAASILEFSYVGFIDQQILVGDRQVINVPLNRVAEKLEDVVVVGYGTQKKSTLTGAVVSVSGDDLLKAPVSGVSNALAGLVPGLQSIQQSGEFGSDKADIYIRGIATFNASTAGPLILVDGVERSTYNNIDPNEIETINFLKDASATAVFGVRGANGVIIITTKQGKAGRLKIGATANAAMLQPTILPNYLGSYDYAMLRNEAIDNSKANDKKFTDDELRLYQSGEDPIFHSSNNWIRETIARFSLQQSYNVNASGGTDKLRYFTSLGYFNQGGAYRKPDQDFGFPYKQNFNRYNIRANFDFNLSQDFTMSVKLGQQITDNSTPNGGAWGAFDKAANTSPMSGPPFVNGKYVESISGLPGGAPFMNVWGQAGPTSTGGAFVTDVFDNTLNTNIALRYKLDKLVRGLSVRAMGSYDSYYKKSEVRSKYFPAYSIIQSANAPDGYIMYKSSDDGPYYNLTNNIGDNKWRKTYAEAGVEYQRTFASHHITALGLATAEKKYDPTLKYDLPTAYLGFVGRVTYDYQSRYLAEFNMGYNGSENFPEGKRFGFFPSFSLGWVATQEKFFPENNILTYLKLRGSYGEVGNDKVNSDWRYLYLDEPWVSNNGGWQAVTFGNAGLDLQRYNVYREGAIGNHDVTWERAQKMNLGADMRFFSDKLTVSADYFTEKRNSILWTLSTVPEIVVASLKPANIGKAENYGYEIEAGYKDKINKFNYWLRGTYSFARNKIVFQDEVTREYEYMQRTGRRIGQYFGLTYDGFYNTQAEVDDPKRPVSAWSGNQLAPGDMKYKDLNSDAKIDANDMGPIGYSNLPEIGYSFSFGGSWKGFDFSVLMQGASHVSVYYSSSAVAYPFTNKGWGAAHAWALERWTPERYANGDKITFPRVELNPGMQHNYQISNFWVQNGSYLRLKNMEVGYRFTGGFLKRLNANYLRVYLNGNNLLTFSHIKYRTDPDAREQWGRVYPSMRVFNGGVNIQF